MSDSGLEKFILDKLDKLDDKLDQVRVDNAKIRESVFAHEKNDEAIHKGIMDMSKFLSGEMVKTNEALKVYNDQLKEHMRRTELLEIAHTTLKDRVEPVVQAFEANKVVDKYISDKWAKRLKILGGLSVLIGIMATIAKLFGG